MQISQSSLTVESDGKIAEKSKQFHRLCFWYILYHRTFKRTISKKFNTEGKIFGFLALITCVLR